MKSKAAFVAFYAIQAANGSGVFSSSWAHMGQQKYEAAKIGKSGEQDYKSAFLFIAQTSTWLVWKAVDTDREIYKLYHSTDCQKLKR